MKIRGFHLTDLKPGITVLLPAKNEEPRIANAIKQFKPYVDAVIVIEDGSSDQTFEIAKQLADKAIHLTMDLPEVHQSHLYNAGLKHVETTHILVADCDEIWDVGLLSLLKKAITDKPDVVCFRFPRLNLPDGKDFPDYQVRLVQTKWTIWKEDPHSIPYFRGKKTGSDEIIEWIADKMEGIETVDNFPILHLPRRTDGIRRPWW
jgi:glycosyltransferase involved in cell wall biosynthesis